VTEIGGHLEMLVKVNLLWSDRDALLRRHSFFKCIRVDVTNFRLLNQNIKCYIPRAFSAVFEVC